MIPAHPRRQHLRLFLSRLKAKEAQPRPSRGHTWFRPSPPPSSPPFSLPSTSCLRAQETSAFRPALASSTGTSTVSWNPQRHFWIHTPKNGEQGLKETLCTPCLAPEVLPSQSSCTGLDGGHSSSQAACPFRTPWCGAHGDSLSTSQRTRGAQQAGCNPGATARSGAAWSLGSLLRQCPSLMKAAHLLQFQVPAAGCRHTTENHSCWPWWELGFAGPPASGIPAQVFLGSRSGGPQQLTASLQGLEEHFKPFTIL